MTTSSKPTKTLRFDKKLDIEFGEFHKFKADKILSRAGTLDRDSISRLISWEKLNSNRENLIADLQRLHSRLSHTDENMNSKMSKRFAMWVGGIVLAIALAALAGSVYRVAIGCGANSTNDACHAKRKEKNVVKTAIMPDLRQKPLPEAKTMIDALKINISLSNKDVISSRSVWNEDNWVVVNQTPGPGTVLKYGEHVCIGIVKADESWQTPNHLQCWQDAGGGLPDSGNVEFLSHDLVKISNLSTSLNGQYLRATIRIEMDRGDTVSLPFCTYSSVTASQSNFKLDASDGGDPGLFADGGQSFKAGLFLNWSGAFRFSITKLEVSRSVGCFSY